MGSGMGPMGLPDPVDERHRDGRGPQPGLHRGAQVARTASRTTAPRCTSTAAPAPWISDGTPHQWITPANETTPWPQGVAVRDVPDMSPADVPNDGIQTFYYTNQQSARLLFYHDHAWGITRLNVYAGEAAGYLISDDKEKALVDSGTIPADQIPLIVQDRTFVPDGLAALRHRHHLRPGSDLGQGPLGRLRQLLVPPRVHAGAEPR